MNASDFRRCAFALSTFAGISLALAGCASGGGTQLSNDTQRPFPPLPATDAASMRSWQGPSRLGKAAGVYTVLTLGDALVLRYGQPLQCTLQLRAEGENAYAVAKSNGGACDNALNGMVRTTPGASGALSIDVKDDDGTSIGSGDLSPAH